MKYIHTIKYIVVAALTLAVGANFVLAGNPNPKVLPPQSTAFDKTYGNWGAEWWKWALSFPLAQSPINDPNGQFGSAGQSGPVWFLAGNFGGVSERWITIPKGKAIFFPLGNWWNDWPCPDPAFAPAPGQTLEQFLIETVAPLTAMIDSLSAEVDGVALQDLFDYRGTSNLTEFVADPSQVAVDTCITGQLQWGVADGYWLMLTPLTPGEHTIHFASGASSWGFSLDVTYHVTIK